MDRPCALAKKPTIQLRRPPDMSRAEYLAQLESRHQALQAEIVEACAHPSTDNLQIVALKRRKLLVKDEIVRLQATVQTERIVAAALR
jgi:hypothetical protein